MKDVKNIIAMIPARIGSARLRLKNLALLNGKPVISYAINAAQSSGIFNRIVVNSDHELFLEIAKRYNVEFYLRPKELGSSTTKSDSVVYDFMMKNPSNILVWVNPTSPLQTGFEIRKVLEYFENKNLDTLITVKNEKLHCVYNEKPINFNINEVFAQTQDLVPVQSFVYSLMMWKNRTFIKAFEKKGYALLCGRIGYYPVSKETAIIIKTKEDIMFAECVLRAKKPLDGYDVKYDELVKKL